MRKPITLTSDDSNSGIELLDRDVSILAFNERVLDWAKRPEVPLLERLRYLCIVSSNLDEFFEVRADLHMSAFRNGDEKGTYNTKTFETVYNTARDLVNEQYSLYNAVLLPSLQKEGIKLLSHADRNLVQKNWVKNYFRREVNPLLVPVGLDPAHPFPQVANKSLNFIVQLSGKDAFGRSNDIAIVKVPRVLPRVIPLPAKVAGHGKAFVLLSSVIRAHLNDLFPGREVGHFSQFRVTRNSDLSVDEEEVENLRTALRKGLQHRQYGQALRLEVSDSCSEHLSDFLLKQFSLPKSALFRAAGPVNLVRLSQLIDLVDDPALLFPAYQSSFPKQLKQGESIFARMQKGDVLIHQPFESFDGVLAFLKEAVEDPQVLAIKQTIYRTGSDPAMMNLLREAVRRGKEVTAVVELKARFDEEANINWAEQLESVGAQVVYGVVGLKTHAKMLLVTRREGRALKRYGHLSTGNYNPRTAKLYTDLSYLTSDVRMTADMETLFVHLASPSRLGRMNKLWSAPFFLQKNMVEKIEAVGAAAAKGLPARIVAKMNSLTDPVLVHALISAGQKGAQIDLIVRGACMLPAGIPGKTDNIRVRSIIGRFLEHSRVFFFETDTVQDFYLSSADWMSRNMTRRVELAWPVLELSLRQRLIDECLLAYLHDTRNAWTLDADGKYRRVEKQGRKPQSAQALLMQKYSPAQTRSR
ncbi:MAG: polyphosphate kinase 1 [Burkholderiaceae bacterium]|nr:polyphosphate kinase 1 [Burkholderiaceae bacterium]